MKLNKIWDKWEWEKIEHLLLTSKTIPREEYISKERIILIETDLSDIKNPKLLVVLNYKGNGVLVKLPMQYMEE